MKDTTPEVEAFYHLLLMQRSGAERLKMGCEMFDAARMLVRDSLGPVAGMSAAELREHLLRRTYGRDLDPDTLERVARRLAATSPAART